MTWALRSLGNTETGCTPISKSCPVSDLNSVTRNRSHCKAALGFEFDPKSSIAILSRIKYRELLKGLLANTEGWDNRMYCFHCGKQMADNATFCPNCGASASGT